MKTRPTPPKREDYKDLSTGNIDEEFYIDTEKYIEAVEEWQE